MFLKKTHLISKFRLSKETVSDTVSAPWKTSKKNRFFRNTDFGSLKGYLQLAGLKNWRLIRSYRRKRNPQSFVERFCLANKYRFVQQISIMPFLTQLVVGEGSWHYKSIALLDSRQKVKQHLNWLNCFQIIDRMIKRKRCLKISPKLFLVGLKTFFYLTANLK